MTRTLIIALAILAPLLPGCMIPAGMAATVWATAKTISRVVRVIEFVVPDEPDEEVEKDGRDNEIP